MTTIFGTCRIAGIAGNNRLNELLSYTHSTKEVLQLIKYIKGYIKLESPYDILCFRAGICFKTPIKYKEEYLDLFNSTKIFVIEICSRKKYIHKGYYLHHLCVDKRFPSGHSMTPNYIHRELEIVEQSDNEILEDILEIKKILSPKPLIIVSHYDSKMNDEYIDNRHKLILLLTDICQKYNINFINPTLALSKYEQREIMSDDLGHYTNLGLKLITDHINKYIKETFNI